MLPRGVEDLAAAEIAGLGGSEVRAAAGGLSFAGDLGVAYRVLLWSRLASRLLVPLWRVPAGSSQAFYEAVRAMPWERELVRGGTFAVDVHARNVRELNQSREPRASGDVVERTTRPRGVRGINTHFVALRTKDAIVDRLRELWGKRPDVDVERPALRVHVLVSGGAATGGEAQLSLDLSGEPLHRRGYRAATGAAPLKENVAAAMLLRAGWPAIAAGRVDGDASAGGAVPRGAFVDPMCGAGTLLVEAAWIAGDVAPGLLRGDDGFGFRGWRGHDQALWTTLRREAERRRAAGLASLPPLLGSDADPRAIERARAAFAVAGIPGVELERRDVGDASPPRGASTGLVATNAPYGHRIGDAESLRPVYGRLGDALKARFDGWTVALLTADASLAGELRLRASKRNALWNGAIRCELLQYRIGRGSIPGREG